MDVLTVHYRPDRLHLCLIGGGASALTLAEQWPGLGLRVTVYSRALSSSLEALIEREGWAHQEQRPAPAPGVIWVVATDDEHVDQACLREALDADVPVYAPRFPEQSSVHLPGRHVQGRAIKPRGGPGHVTLVGAGPGDPGLLTLKAVDALEAADMVVHDRLVSREILSMIRPEAQRFYVGKARSDHSVPQEDINRSLAEWAKAGYRVVRLKGGDPFVFGRGGEELEELANHGVSFEVVPGITAAIGVSSYSGIPLTHRDHAQSVRFITGHLKNGSCDLDWPTLAQPGQTLVFYMGLGTLGVICDQLIAHGAPAERPVALVEQGTTARQQVHVGTLGTMAAYADNIDIAPPTLIIVGDVVSLHEKLHWFDPNGSSSLGWRHGKHPTPEAAVSQQGDLSEKGER
ncbi:uroporphyrinogen-III C-methyltransferase [Larsenimonas suaedae]|uniref:uroporphyrinogen-III C-methyltransferase n=1 Tax=Larsenimonas suaedae TaxID=1851019 RepID=UPI00286D2367|nr:uroporphyrinogen-III C-methyltransferase [Larsenimonas suaedae]